MAKSPHLSRREFGAILTAFLGTVIGAVVGLPAIGYIISPALKTQSKEAWVPLGPLDNYPVGVPTLFTFTRTKVNGWEKTVNSYGVYVFRKEGGEIEAFSNLCTHLSCRVTWQAEAGEYICPCHDGHFDTQGEVTFGPPPRPLDKYEFKIEDGNLSILLREA
ncbi:MAG: Rieske (2Fe-2S) protein [Anaerolineales bacterium]|nr:Rieske (2Fe-2S) protein [Anaerolineales bacterium]